MFRATNELFIPLTFKFSFEKSFLVFSAFHFHIFCIVTALIILHLGLTQNILFDVSVRVCELKLHVLAPWTPRCNCSDLNHGESGARDCSTRMQWSRAAVFSISMLLQQQRQEDSAVLWLYLVSLDFNKPHPTQVAIAVRLSILST